MLNILSSVTLNEIKAHLSGRGRGVAADTHFASPWTMMSGDADFTGDDQLLAVVW